MIEKKNIQIFKDCIKNNKYYIFIVLICIIISIPMFIPNFNIQYDDGIQHICRLIGTYQSIEEGQIFPVIISKLCNNFGYSWNLFYSPLTAYFPLIFKIFGCNFSLCLKLFIFFVNIATGMAMYSFILKITKKKTTALLGAILYILVPYRLNDMYFRMAIPELTTFIFLPMVFNGLYTIVNLKEKTHLLTIRSNWNATYTQYANCVFGDFLYDIFNYKY